MHTRYLDRREAAEYLTRQRGLSISWRTLQKMATVGGGPTYRIFGIRAVYTEADLDDWANAKLSEPRSSTSEAHSVARSAQSDGLSGDAPAAGGGR